MRIARLDDAVSADLRMGPPQGRKTLWGEEDAPQRGGLPVRGSTTEAKVASDEKACVSLSNEGMDFAKKESFLPIEINEH